MFLKLGILCALLLIGGFIFSSQIQSFFPNSSTTGVDSLKSDAKILATKSIESAEEKIDSSVNQTQTKLSELKQDSSEYIEKKILDKILFLNPNK